MTREKSLTMSARALFRYQVVSALRGLLLGGVGRMEAIEQVATMEHWDGTSSRRLSPRTLRRWLKAFETNGLAGLEPKSRSCVETSQVLAAELIAFLRTEKQSDEEASVPELLRRAKERGLVAPSQRVDRTTVWRAFRRLAVPTTRVQRLAFKDMRRFEYPHRMMMCLADGKHFRAGVSRLERVALIYLDDCSRFGLGAIVGTSETSCLFLEGLHQVISRHGLMEAMFLDGGSGFRANDTHAVAARLEIAFMHGTPHYPEGRGKIERFNQTLLSQLLRGFDGNPEIDPEATALALRINHWLANGYNRTPHEGIGGQSPEQKWQADAKPLRFPSSREWLDERFVLTHVRKRRKDRTVPFDGVHYELPLGYNQPSVTLVRPVRQPDLIYLQDGEQRVRLHPVDAAANAYVRRAKKAAKAAANDEPKPVATAAAIHFEATFAPLIDGDGNYTGPTVDPNAHQEDTDV